VTAASDLAPEGPTVVLRTAPGEAPPLREDAAIVLVTADPGDADLAGAFDVLRVPAPPAEVVARIRAAARYAVLSAEVARTDPLTGLSNRRHLDEHLEMVSSSSRRLRVPASILVVDIDRLTRINESLGFTAGDAVLREVGRRISARLRGEDLVGRWRTDEFLVILPHTPLDGAWRLGDRIREAVSEDPVKLDGDEIVVTVSVGCAEGNGDDVADHVSRASAALFEAKHHGRNRVIADPTPAL
jgi:two-component system cell cycle response regulator